LQYSRTTMTSIGVTMAKSSGLDLARALVSPARE
jgi:hypothetical protein